LGGKFDLTQTAMSSFSTLSYCKVHEEVFVLSTQKLGTMTTSVDYV